METIEIKEKEKRPTGWEFLVVVGPPTLSLRRTSSEGSKTEHTVTLDKKYWEKLTQENEEPEELIRRSFVFLLEREPKESILSEFNLHVIQNYFPEYEDTILKA